MIKITRRFQVVAGLVAVASCGVLAVLPASASAAAVPQAHHVTAVSRPAIGQPGPRINSPADAFDQEACSGDVCMILYWDGISTNFTITAGANSNAFNGYFHLSGPGGPFDPANSPTRNWSAHGISGGDAYHANFTHAVPQDGVYCASAFQNGSSIGKACVPYGIA